MADEIVMTPDQQELVEFAYSMFDAQWRTIMPNDVSGKSKLMFFADFGREDGMGRTCWIPFVGEPTLSRSAAEIFNRFNSLEHGRVMQRACFLTLALPFKAADGETRERFLEKISRELGEDLAKQATPEGILNDPMEPKMNVVAMALDRKGNQASVMAPLMRLPQVGGERRHEIGEASASVGPIEVLMSPVMQVVAFHLKTREGP